MDDSRRRGRRGKHVSDDMATEVTPEGGIQFRIALSSGSETELGSNGCRGSSIETTKDAVALAEEEEVDVSTELDGSQFRISLSGGKGQEGTETIQNSQENVSNTLVLILQVFGKTISVDDAERELLGVLEKSNGSRGRMGRNIDDPQEPNMKAVRVFLDRRGLTLGKRSDRHSTKWTVLHPAGGPFMLLMKVWFTSMENPDGDETSETFALVYHNRRLKDHSSSECNVGVSDLANAQKAGRVFDRFFSVALRTRGLFYKKCSLISSWEINKRNLTWTDCDFHRETLPGGLETTTEDQKWPDYHRHSLPEAVALIVSGLDDNAYGVAVRQELAAITTVAAENNATGPGNLNMGVVSGFLANRGFCCKELNEYASRGAFLQEPDGYFLLILSVFLENMIGSHSYQLHAIGCHKQLLRDCLTKETGFSIGRFDNLSHERIEDLFDAHFKAALGTRDVQYKHCALIGAWVIAKMNEIPESQSGTPTRVGRKSDTAPGHGVFSFESPEAKHGVVNDGSTQQRIQRACWSRGGSSASLGRTHEHVASTSERIRLNTKRGIEGVSHGQAVSSTSPRNDSGIDVIPRLAHVRQPKKGRFTPITGEYTSIPDALAVLLRSMNLKADDIPHDRLNHDQWLESVARYVKLPVTRYLDSKGLKLEPLPQGVLNNHLSILRESRGSHLVILTIHFEDDQHGHVPRMTQGVAWLAKERLLVCGNSLENSREVTDRDIVTELAAARLFDSFLRPLAGSNRVYRFSSVRCAYRIKKCFSTKPANQYHRGLVDGWSEWNG